MRRRLAVAFAAACLLVGAGAASAAIAPSQAAQHVGETVEVEGHVDSVVCSPMACLISFEPGFGGLVVAIPGDAVPEFPDPEATYEARDVRVRGRIVERNGRPRIEVRDVGAIAIAAGPAAAPIARSARAVASPRPRTVPADAVAGRVDSLSTAPEREPMPAEAGQALASRATTPRPSRSEIVASGPPEGDPAAATSFAAGGGVRVDVERPRAKPLSASDAAARLGLPAEDQAPDDGAALGSTGELALLRQELASVARRLEAVEGAIDELVDRVAVLEAVAGPVLAEREARDESVGAPPPRRGSPALHRVSRGYSAKQVLRLMGEPLHVESNPNGQYTWTYEGGRAVTIDARGVVLSAVGF